MKYNFDEIIDRTGTDCVKWDYYREFLKEDDLLPLWVADSDFECPPKVKEAIVSRASHGIYGYSSPPDSYYDSILNWTETRYNWKIKRDWLSYSPGIVTALNILVQALTKPGEKIVVQSPVYYPFFKAIENNDRVLINNQLLLKKGKYEIDFENLEHQIDFETKMIFFCSPHNPVGRVWSEDELIKLGKIAEKHDLIIISDDIHSDIIYGDNKYVPISSLSEKLAMRTVTCIAPSKTFNIAGLESSSIIIPNPQIMTKYKRAMGNLGLHAAFSSKRIE